MGSRGKGLLLSYSSCVFHWGQWQVGPFQSSLFSVLLDPLSACLAPVLTGLNPRHSQPYECLPCTRSKPGSSSSSVALSPTLASCCCFLQAEHLFSAGCREGSVHGVDQQERCSWPLTIPLIGHGGCSWRTGGNGRQARQTLLLFYPPA